MSQEFSGQGKPAGRSVFVPVLLIALTLMVMAIFQTSQLLRDRQRLDTLHTGQEKLLSDARNVRQQFDSLAQGTARLAARGNQNAALLIAELKKIGVTVSLPDSPAE